MLDGHVTGIDHINGGGIKRRPVIALVGCATVPPTPTPSVSPTIIPMHALRPTVALPGI
jgi:hypothetical protein